MATKRKILGAFVAFALITGITVLTFGFKADHKKESKRATTYYFQYSGSNSETDYEDPANWSDGTDIAPEENPCIVPGSLVCTLKADFDSTPTANDLALYLQSLDQLDPDGATIYCTASGNIEYYRVP